MNGLKSFTVQLKIRKQASKKQPVQTMKTSGPACQYFVKTQANITLSLHLVLFLWYFWGFECTGK